MARFEHLVFVCVNEREADNPKGCCHAKGAAEVLDRLRELTHTHGLKGKVRVTSSGCLNLCKKGVAVVVFSAVAPAGESWYTGVTPEQAEALFRRHILEGERYEG